MNFKMGSDTYDFLKYMAQVVIPALSVLIIALGKIWGFPLSEAIAGTLMAIDTFLGAILKKSSDNYWAEQGEDDEK